jgi:hypothetical protein
LIRGNTGHIERIAGRLDAISQVASP